MYFVIVVDIIVVFVAAMPIVFVVIFVVVCSLLCFYGAMLLGKLEARKKQKRGGQKTGTTSGQN